MSDDVNDLQKRIGSRVRQRRMDLGYTLRILAERAGLSARFLSGLEAGRANISIGRLSQLAAALDLPLGTLIRPEQVGVRRAVEELLARCTPEELEGILSVIEIILRRRTPPIIALLGIRGAGKSRVGALLAAELRLPFVELTERVEARAGLPLGDVFTLYGEGRYRALELECFTELIEAGERCVVAMPGGVVSSPEAMTLLAGCCTSVWLRATAEDYWDRVFAQGDTRPMVGRSDPRAELRALIRRRDPLYARADIVVDTSGLDPSQVTRSVLTALDAGHRRPLTPSKD